MEFNEKLQELRKREGMTQEELAGKLYVSRTAISKWESGRGYPNIESLKAIARLFSVTVDELLSSDEILTVAEEEIKHKEQGSRCFVLALLDISAVLLLFLPLFEQRVDENIESVALIALAGVPIYLKILYFAAILGTVLSGMLALCLQALKTEFLSRGRVIISFVLGIVSVLLFMLSLKPYAAAFAFALLVVKAFVVLKK